MRPFRYALFYAIGIICLFAVFGGDTAKACDGVWSDEQWAELRKEQLDKAFTESINKECSQSWFDCVDE